MYANSVFSCCVSTGCTQHGHTLEFGYVSGKDLCGLILISLQAHALNDRSHANEISDIWNLEHINFRWYHKTIWSSFNFIISNSSHFSPLCQSSTLPHIPCTQWCFTSTQWNSMAWLQPWDLKPILATLYLILNCYYYGMFMQQIVSWELMDSGRNWL